MAKTCRTRVRMWRWRRNSLRRRSDVIEAWVVLIAAIVAIVGGLVAGVTVAQTAEESLNRQRLERRTASAVLTEDAPGMNVARVVGEDRVWATVRWTAPDGSARTGLTQVLPDTAKGTPVTVWTDRQGRLEPKPGSPAAARFQGAWAGTLAAISAGVVVIGAAQLVRGQMDRRRMQEWADEWQRVDGRWGRATS
ncbi:Rv1733c family protein [Streptomyces sp. NBC_00576]|uniref:Rv1733c family protein n=1 Tax=Streptomyces sp. NBC_00576 TaxID=2903665 RepID=UPI002E81B4DB|nr:hypothetical protein [Streptomyces sp. NBC_00576]WUB71063.1 hypothetical protein OG734_13740 [Streptomyces sp. NBC_00576]